MSCVWKQNNLLVQSHYTSPVCKVLNSTLRLAMGLLVDATIHQPPYSSKHVDNNHTEHLYIMIYAGPLRSFRMSLSHYDILSTIY